MIRWFKMIFSPKKKDRSLAENEILMESAKLIQQTFPSFSFILYCGEYYQAIATTYGTYILTKKFKDSLEAEKAIEAVCHPENYSIQYSFLVYENDCKYNRKRYHINHDGI